MKTGNEGRKRGVRGEPHAESVLVPAKPAARSLGVPYTTLRDLAFRGAIPVVRVGRAWFFDRRDLTRFVERSKETLGA